MGKLGISKFLWGKKNAEVRAEGPGQLRIKANVDCPIQEKEKDCEPADATSTYGRKQELSSAENVDPPLARS